MAQADIHYWTEGDTLKIKDLNLGGKSVTNDAENVLTRIHIALGAQVKKMKIHYQDTDGRWDTIVPVWQDNRCISVKFLPGCQ